MSEPSFGWVTSSEFKSISRWSPCLVPHSVPSLSCLKAECFRKLEWEYFYSSCYMKLISCSKAAV